ncbi:p48 polypeptide of DNA primase [Blastocladiella emersonii ATCC 22665]|nr:p48 polypeptide of DNA primase [Blastocladiella emersonii ATCC 22665]
METDPSPSPAAVADAPAPEAPSAADIAAQSMELLPAFYRRFFPLKEYGRWLSYGGAAAPTGRGAGASAAPMTATAGSDTYLGRREFSFTLANDAYLRFKSYDSADELMADLLALQPVKIDVGAVYAVPPKKKKMVQPGAFVPLEKELVVDIDMTDYDDLRTCCTGGDVCRRCWPLMAAAQRVLDAALRQDFGFKHILWVYSGRRGIHGWVCDAAARALSNEARTAIVKYLDLVRAGDQVGRKVVLPAALHPALRRAYDDVLAPNFVQTVLVNQQILAKPESAAKVLATIPDDALRARVRGRWSDVDRERARGRAGPPTSDDDDEDGEDGDSSRDTRATAAEKWEHLERLVGKAAASTASGAGAAGSAKTKRELATLPRDLVFQFMYPRIDANVSTHINHLLKSPFCVHPKTGRVCVPIDPRECETFDPTTVPTVVDLMAELDASMSVDGDSPDWARTSLKPYVEHFRSFVQGLELEIRRKLRQEQQDESMEF